MTTVEALILVPSGVASLAVYVWSMVRIYRVSRRPDRDRIPWVDLRSAMLDGGTRR